VATRYAICPNRYDPAKGTSVDSATVFDSLPVATKDLLRRSHAVPVVAPTGWNVACRVLALDDARAVQRSLVDAGLVSSDSYGATSYEIPNRTDPPVEVTVFLVPLLPSGDFVGLGS
jgi:hypothetical protein